MSSEETCLPYKSSAVIAGAAFYGLIGLINMAASSGDTRKNVAKNVSFLIGTTAVLGATAYVAWTCRPKWAWVTLIGGSVIGMPIVWGTTYSMLK